MATERIFGFDIGTTSIGFAVIEHDRDNATGKILRLGVRIFPESRDPKVSTPLNQKRRQARLRRRQLRRRRERRRSLQDLLQEAELLPAYGTPDWDTAMKSDPYDLRRRAFEGDALSPYEIGRAIYHLAQRRHFKTRDIDEISDDAEAEGNDADENKALSEREQTVEALKQTDKTLGAWLSERGPHERKRGLHATRKSVENEFDRIWPPHLSDKVREAIHQAIFYQRPVFWRLNTLGTCRFVPGNDLCSKGSWLSQQRRMLEQLNNLALAGGNQRSLDKEERQAILSKLETQASMTWGGVRRALAPIYKARGESGKEKALRFNLEEKRKPGEKGEKKLFGNTIEVKLTEILGADWSDHPHKQEIRDAVHEHFWEANYKPVGRRVVIRPATERATRREEATRYFVSKFNLSEAQAAKVTALKLPTGWEPYSTAALQKILPHLEAGVRFGEIINGPGWESWRNDTFPDQEQPTGEVFDRLPSPATPEESKHIASLRNPTVVRARNELRKVTNNLIDMFGKPDLIRVELARDVGNSKRQREEKSSGIHRFEQRRKKARADLEEKNIPQPSRRDIEKWLLWQECGKCCPYTGDSISFAALYSRQEFDIEHIWPRSRSLDNSFRNKTLCRKDANIQKGNQTPFEWFGHDTEKWKAFANRLDRMKAPRSGGVGMSPGKIKQLLAKSIPDDFTSRQLNDTGYAARQAVASLKRLWPDLGPEAPIKVHAVSGRVTGHLRRLWELNNILSDTGEKTRDDHRHHAIDALTVACADPGVTQKLSNYWQAEDDPHIKSPHFPPPWDAVRQDAKVAVKDIVVSHRVRKKISGPLHKETVYGDTAEDTPKNDQGEIYRYFVTRKPVEALSKRELNEIRDENIREIVKTWVDKYGGGEPKNAFPPFPKLECEGPEIRKVRLLIKQQIGLMERVSTGYADSGRNHHIAIYRLPDGAVDYEAVSLSEASRRLAQHKPVVQRDRGDDAKFLMSLSLGDSLQLTKNGKTNIRIIQGVESSGRVALIDHNDAIGKVRFRPRVKSIVSMYNGTKLSIDPIGRIYTAKD